MKKLTKTQKKQIKNKAIKVLNIIAYILSGLFIIFVVVAMCNSCCPKQLEQTTIEIETEQQQSKAIYDGNTLDVGMYTVPGFDGDDEWEFTLSTNGGTRVVAYNFGFPFDNGSHWEFLETNYLFIARDYRAIDEGSFVLTFSTRDGYIETINVLEFWFAVFGGGVTIEGDVTLSKEPIDTTIKDISFSNLWDYENIYLDTYYPSINKQLYAGIILVDNIYCSELYVVYKPYTINGTLTYVPSYFGYEPYRNFGGVEPNYNRVPIGFDRVSGVNFDGSPNFFPITYRTNPWVGNLPQIFIITSEYTFNPNQGGTPNPGGGGETSNIFNDVFALIGSAFGVFGSLFAIEIAPSFYLGTLLIAPLVVVVIILIVKIAMKSGS